MDIIKPLDLIFILLAFIIVRITLYPVKNLFAMKINKSFLIVTINLLVFPLVTMLLGLKVLVDVLLIYLSMYLIIFIFAVNRRYIYLSAIFILLLSPLFKLMHMQSFAEQTAVFAYLMITMGFIKDTLYEKFVN